MRAPSQRRALGVLFLVLAALFAVIVVAAARGGAWVIALAAAALTAWLVSLAAAGLKG